MRDRGWSKKTTDVVRKHRPDYLIALYMGILMLIGLITMYAIGPQRANVLNNVFGSSYSDVYFFIKQSVSVLMAVVAFGFMAFLSHNFIVKHATKLLIIGLAACALLAICAAAGFSFAAPINGASSWFSLGALGSFQPAEVLKFGLMTYLAVFLAKRIQEGNVNDVKSTLIPVGIIMAIVLGFIVIMQRDLGTGISVTAIVLTMLFVAGLNKKNGLIIGALLVVGAIGMIAIAPHRIERVATFFQGVEETRDGGGYHIHQANIAMGTGGLMGVGIGNSVQATGYLPESVNDSVFAILGETFGFVGLVIILAIMVALLMRLLKVMDHLVDQRLKLLAAGVFGWFGAHVILNIAAMLGIFPLTGITLPLLSYGGTSMVFIAAALGMVFQLSRYTVHSARMAQLKEKANENLGSGRRVRRTRYAGRRSS